MRLFKLLAPIILLVASLSGCSLFDDIDKLEAPAMLKTLPPIYKQTGPVAKANIKYYQVNVDDNLLFDASASVDATSYHWQVLEQPAKSHSRFQTPKELQSYFVIDREGEYQLQLTVSDAAGREDHFEIMLSTSLDQLPSSRFIIIGDAGYGTEKQRKVGQAMATICTEQGCDFVLSAGDNIYNTGIDSVRDELIQKNFEQPFSVVQLPFYMVLGNHDSGGIGSDGVSVRGDVQVEYSHWKEKEGYTWQMPARYYRIPAPIEKTNNQPLVNIYALDTNLITSPYDVVQRYNLPDMYQRMSRWIEGEKRQSKAQWQIAFAHHPYLSNGKHGNAGDYRKLEGKFDNGFIDRVRGKYVKDFIENNICGDIPLWMSGHEHNLQDLKSVDGCAGTEFIVSGAAASANGFVDAKRNATHWQAENQLGFFHIEIVAQQLTIRGYTVDEATGDVTLQHQRTVNH